MSQISCGNAEIDARLSALLRDGVRFVLFSIPYALRVEFVGEVTTAPVGAMMGFSGVARLSAPFDVQVPIKLALDAKGRYDLRFTLPDLQRPVSQVRARLSPAQGKTFDTLVQPYVGWYRDCTVVLSSNAGDDPKLGGVLAGVNFYTRVTMGQVEPTRSLCATFPQARLEDREFVLHMGCIANPGFTFVVEGTLMLNAELGTPSAVLDRLVLRIDQDSKSAAASTAAFFRVRVGGEELIFIGALGVDSRGAVMISGSLDAADGAWRDPFGARGLTITNLGVQLMAAPKPPYLGFGLRGGIALGADRLAAELALLVDPSDPSRCVLDVFLDRGLDLRQLVRSVVDPRHVPDELVSVRLDDARLYISPSGGVIAGKEFSPGFAVSGRLELWGWFAEVDGLLTYASGGSLTGTMAPLRFPAEGWLVDIHGEEAAGPEVHIEFNAARQAARVDAAVKIVGKYNHHAQVIVDPKQLVVELGKTQLGVYSGGRVAVGGGRVELGTTVGFHVPDLELNLGFETIRIAVDVEAEYAGRATTSQVAQEVRFAFDACGKRLRFTASAGALRFEEVDSMVRFFRKQSGRIAQMLLGELATAAEAAIAWLSQYLPDHREVAGVLRAANAACEAAARGLRAVFSLTDAQCATALGAAAYSPQAIAGAMHAVYDLSEQQVAALLDSIGMSPSQIATAMHKAFDWSAKQTAKFFDDVLGYSDKVTNTALDAAGYAESEIRGAMEAAYNWGSDAWDTVTGWF